MSTAATAEYNERLAQLYKDAGIDPGINPANAPAAATETGAKETKDTDQVKVFTRTVNGKTFTGRDEVDLINQIAVYAETLPTQSPQKTAEPPKLKTLDDTRKFQIGLDLMKGDTKAIDDYLKESGYIDRALAERGVTIEDLKGAVQRTSSADQQKEAETAATAWLGRQGNDWPGGKGNMKILGFTLASMGLKPGDPESYEKAYQHMKTEGMVLPNPDAKKHDGEKRASKGSTAFGAGAENNTRQATQQNIPTISRSAWDKMTQMQQRQKYEELVGQGFKPEQIMFVA